MKSKVADKVQFEWPESFLTIKRKYLYTRFSVTYEDLQKPVKEPVAPRPVWAVEVTTFVEQCKECGYNYFNQREFHRKSFEATQSGEVFKPHRIDPIDKHDMEEMYLRIAYCLSEELAVALNEADRQAREWVNEHIGRVKQKP